jgi:hypothetical protein
MAASSLPPQAILCRNAGFSRQILAIPVPLPHECGVPGGLDAALSVNCSCGFGFDIGFI